MKEEDKIIHKLEREQLALTVIIEQLDILTPIEFAEFGNALRLNRDVTKGRIEALKWVLDIKYEPIPS
tara:strand:+ start:11212 stop:11415 length:204 start_codon:yes stop_codon:yes gene_type:complete